MPDSLLDKMGRGMCVMCKGICQFDSNFDSLNQVASVVSLQQLYLNFARQALEK